MSLPTGILDDLKRLALAVEISEKNNVQNAGCFVTNQYLGQALSKETVGVSRDSSIISSLNSRSIGGGALDDRIPCFGRECLYLRAS